MNYIFKDADIQQIAKTAAKDILGWDAQPILINAYATVIAKAFTDCEDNKTDVAILGKSLRKR